MFFVILFLAFAVVVPIAIGAALSLSRGWAESWRTADWSSAHLLPEAAAVPEARVMIIAARTGRWKSIFAEHMALVLKPEGASSWTRYDVVGWGNPVRHNAYAADAHWYGNRPYVAAEVTGPKAAALIPLIEQSIARYPHRQAGSYMVWPGPNSNSFVAWVVRNTQGFDVELPPVAVGKDYLGRGLAVDRAPSGSGWTVSAGGIIGLTLALREGIELSLLGTTIGVDPDDLAIKVPSLGRLSLLDLM